MFSAAKRLFIDRVAGAEKRALADRFDRLEALLRANENQPSLERLKDEILSAVQRQRAEQALWAQLDRVGDLQLAGPARSVLFLHNSYYHFYYLARALRLRGWCALSVSLENPNGANAQYYHGEDVNLWDADPGQMRANALAFFEFAKVHFDHMHFAGDGLLSFFPWHFGQENPADIVEWRSLGKTVAYTVSGCSSATSQTSFHAWSKTGRARSTCDNCPWQVRPDVCNDEKNLEWGRRVHAYCDMVFTELQPSLDMLSSDHEDVVRGPCTMVLDEERWSENLEVPEPFRVARQPDELLIYHAFGNYAARGAGDRNIKGTPAIVEAVDKLRHEGFPVRLMFFSSVPNHLVRYYQAQADIVVDQLWAGSWGANGRESLMLGKPVVGYVNRHENEPADLLEAIDQTPVVDATEDTIYEVLKALVLDPERRRALGRASREFALRWHSASEGAKRYEQAYDRMVARRIKTEELPR